jgi:hypothetical protein
VATYLGNKSFVNANAAGQALFDAAINWAMNIQSAPQMTITKQAGNVTITWTDGGNLESTDSLSGTPVWSPITTQNSTYTEAATSGTRFFRIKK